MTRRLSSGLSEGLDGRLSSDLDTDLGTLGADTGEADTGAFDWVGSGASTLLSAAAGTTAAAGALFEDLF